MKFKQAMNFGGVVYIFASGRERKQSFRGIPRNTPNRSSKSRSASANSVPYALSFSCSLTFSLPAMEKGESSASTSEPDSDDNHLIPTNHHLNPTSGLTPHEFASLVPSVTEHHTYLVGPGQCSSLLAQRIQAPPDAVWSVVRRFDKPQTYKHFIKSCAVKDPFHMAVGVTRDVNVISGLPAATSTERLDILDDDRRVTGFSIIGGEHRLRNYRSVTTVHAFDSDADAKIYTVVLESYVVDVPDGNTEEDTRLFADTVVKLNLQKLATVTEGTNRDGDCKPHSR
ncbi:unnamed protein product [Sphenostylis stenocarpa]|uniref:Uncharacterized protein n=1 Tax=Sphenostylis stenocarpa TaxID=92480 RepID=A0AA86VDQ5_9FABA|nr:unnamed protein product [Sphenostylis stenocarpa]